MIDSVNDYYFKKKALLKQCLTLSEEFISNVQNWESLDDILMKKREVINEIELLEQSFGQGFMEHCSEDQRKKIDQLITLILNLDQEAAKLIKKEQDEVLNLIKANIQEQKLVQYGSNLIPNKGMHLDYKK